MKKLIGILYLTGLLCPSVNAQFFINQTNGNVGIGKTSPAYPLDANGIINASSYYVNGVPFAGGGSQWITSGSNIYFNAGSVGMGTASPYAGSRLEITPLSGQFQVDGLRLLKGSNTDRNWVSFWQGGGTSGVYRLGQLAYSDGLALYVGGTDPATPGALLQKWNFDGNVGIGTPAPTSKLHVSGDMNLSGQILFGNNGRISIPGSQNIFIGELSGINNSGSSNTANGSRCLYANTTGSNNTAFGNWCLNVNTTGNYNTAVGAFSLGTNITGNYNTGIGFDTYSTSSNLSNTTAVGYGAITTASNQIRIGNSSVTSIGGYAAWSILSDMRFKTNIKEDVSGLDFINLLRPVSYSIDKEKLDIFFGVPQNSRYRDSSGRKAELRQTGFIAQEVEDAIKKNGYVFYGVESPQNERDHYSIRYAEFVVPLVKAVQELSSKVEAQQKKIDALTNFTEKNSNELGTLDAPTLFQNIPNPFREGTEIKMYVPKEVVQAHILVYDMQGKQLQNIPVTERGNTSVKIEGGKLTAGLYLYTLIADQQSTEVKRMILTE